MLRKAPTAVAEAFSWLFMICCSEIPDQFPLNRRQASSTQDC
jgi:hypothetical protein